jgi:hypothetical protein
MVITWTLYQSHSRHHKLCSTVSLHTLCELFHCHWMHCDMWVPKQEQGFLSVLWGVSRLTVVYYPLDLGCGQMLHTGKQHLKRLLAAQEVRRWSNAAYWEIVPKRLLAAQEVRRWSNAAYWETPSKNITRGSGSK